MRTPLWLAAHIETLNLRRGAGDMDRDAVIGKALADAAKKDPDLMAQIHYEWFAGRVDDGYKRLQTKRLDGMVAEADREVTEAANGHVQPTLDDDLFRGPDSTLLTEDGAYAYSLLGYAERHQKRAERRVEVYEQRVEAVGGNRDGKATRAQAIKALRRTSGGEAAVSG